VSSDNYRKIEDALARQRREEESRQSTLDRAAQSSCASLRIADLANILSDALKDSERRLIGHVRRTVASLDLEREKGRVFNIHRRLTQLESQVRLLAKAAKKTSVS
jgi:hypothetical protein